MKRADNIAATDSNHMIDKASIVRLDYIISWIVVKMRLIIYHVSEQ